MNPMNFCPDSFDYLGYVQRCSCGGLVETRLTLEGVQRACRECSAHTPEVSSRSDEPAAAA